VSAVECVACGSRADEIRVRLGGVSLAECARCRTWTYAPRPDDVTQAGIHDSEEYYGHQYFDLRRTITPRLRRRCRATFARIGRWIDLESLRGERLLDVGCDTGAFARCAADEFGIVPVGIDVAGRAVEQARQSGVEAYRSTIETAPQSLRDFRVVTAIDVVEHVSNPLEFLQALIARLRPGGVTYLETPNIHSAVYRVGAGLCGLAHGRPIDVWERLFPPQHLQYFTRLSFSRLAERAGFEIREIDTRPLPAPDIAASMSVRLGVGALQAWDRLIGTEILICAVLAAPGSSSSAAPSCRNES